MNPRVGSRAQQTCTIEEEEAVGVVRNHEDGTRSRLAASSRWRVEGNLGKPGADSPVENDGGAVFGKPQERNSGVIDIGTLGPECVGKEARKVTRVDSIGHQRVRSSLSEGRRRSP